MPERAIDIRTKRNQAEAVRNAANAFIAEINAAEEMGLVVDLRLRDNTLRDGRASKALKLDIYDKLA